MKPKSLSLFLVLALAGPFALVSTSPAAQAAAAEPDWAGLIGPFPPLGSKQADEELAIMLWLQRTRTSVDVARETAEVNMSLDNFAEVLGPGFNVAAHPRTVALLDQARRDSWHASGSLKEKFKRPRPYLSYPALTPAVHRETSYSYPSGHATLGVVYGRLLAELCPARKDAILERGLLIGNDRTSAGVHWPSDVDAGHKLGAAFAEFWLASKDHQKLLAEARGEWR